jgi:hypothetical protein
LDDAQAVNVTLDDAQAGNVALDDTKLLNGEELNNPTKQFIISGNFSSSPRLIRM